MRAANNTAYETLSTVDFNFSAVLAELVTYIEETVKEADSSSVFKMADLTNFYMEITKQL